MRSTLTLLAVAATLASAPVAAQTTFNPFAPTLGFDVFTSGNFTVKASDTHGPLAVGGNLVLDGSAPLVMNTSGTYPTGTLNHANNYGLVVNGRIIYSGGNNPTYVNKGLVRVGNMTGSTAYDRDNNNAATDLQITGGQFNATPRVQKQNGHQAANTVTGAHGINFTTAFTTLVANSNIINNYSTTSACAGSMNFISLPTCMTQGNNPCNNWQVPLVANKINYINITTAADWAKLGSLGTMNLNNNGVQPSATSPLIINVQLSGSLAWNMPNMGSVSAQHGPYILWNFSNATEISFSNNNSVYGSVLAPLAAINKNGGNNLEGQVASASFILQTGEVHYQPFAVNLPQCASPSAIVLSLENITLAGERAEGGVALSWTGTGADEARMRVERSEDGRTWGPLSIAVQGGRSFDADAPASAVQYRLTEVQPDGSIQYSNTVRVAAARVAAALQVGPNPFQHTLSVVVPQGGAGTLRLTDAAGRTVAQEAAVEGATATFQNLGSLPAGMYLLVHTTSAGVQSVTKLVR